MITKILAYTILLSMIGSFIAFCISLNYDYLIVFLISLIIFITIPIGRNKNNAPTVKKASAWEQKMENINKQKQQ